MTGLSNTPRIRSAAADDVARIGAIAHAADALYVPRIGREPAPMVQHVVNRFTDPAAALVPRYLSLRTRKNTPLSPSGDFFLDGLEGFTDGLVISAVIAARDGKHKTAAQRLLNISSGALPLFSEGFSLLIHLTKELCELPAGNPGDNELPDQEQHEKLKALLQVLFKWAPFVNISSPTLTFRGNNLARPKYDEVAQQPTPADGWTPAPAH